MPCTESRNRAKLGEPRSEEHTSELQSRLHLVCRLLLEKKKVKKSVTAHGIAQRHLMITHAHQAHPELSFQRLSELSEARRTADYGHLQQSPHDAEDVAA